MMKRFGYLFEEANKFQNIVKAQSTILKSNKMNYSQFNRLREKY